MLSQTCLSLLDKIAPWVFINTRQLNVIDEFYSYFGVQDVLLLTLGIIMYLQLRKATSNRVRLAGLILYTVSFFYLFPDFAAAFEVKRVFFFEEENGDMIEGFNLLYVWFRYPTYWTLGLLIVLIEKLKRRYQFRLKNG
jgi:hypothetical protein